MFFIENLSIYPSMDYCQVGPIWAGFTILCSSRTPVRDFIQPLSVWSSSYQFTIRLSKHQYAAIRNAKHPVDRYTNDTHFRKKLTHTEKYTREQCLDTTIID